ncbi:HEPN domain-containing protein [Rickettsia sp. 2024-CO-Wats]|uniref:HEPN domain-containing protein n=1 Tax=unclassified Rickettsia TaxID=114295 RepID=UPI00370DA99B
MIAVNLYLARLKIIMHIGLVEVKVFKGATTYLNDLEYALSAFAIHQATESLYSSILLVFSNYKPELHNLQELGSMAENYDNELWSVFLQLTEEQKKCFELLEKAYVDARYDKNYKITKEQLLLSY